MRTKLFKHVSLLLGLACFSVLSSQAAAPATPQGYINYRTYNGDQRAAIRTRTATPDGSYYPKRAEGPYPGFPDADLGNPEDVPAGDVRNNYTMEVIGYFYPPKSGTIQLAIAADDPGELWFSTDENPANKKQIASEPSWNPVRSFGSDQNGRTRVNDGTQPAERLINQSAYITVVAGKPYFIQGIATEWGGGDNLAIAFRYNTDPEFANNDFPIDGKYLSPFYSSTGATFISQPQDAYVYAPGTATFTGAVDVGPTGSVTSVKWTKNGTDIPNSNSLSLNLSVAAADDGAKIRAVVTTSSGTIQSNEATLNVATLTNDFVPGLLKWEAWRGAGTGSANDFRNDLGSATDVSFLTRFEGPTSWAENYVSRISGFFVPPTTGNYVFFISADDNAELYLSTDDRPANKQLIANESAWSNSRQWTSSGGSSDLDNKRSDMNYVGTWPTFNVITLTAGKRYYIEMLQSEGGGGDNASMTWIREGDPIPANGSLNTDSSVFGVLGKPSKGTPEFTTTPKWPAQLEEGKSYQFAADGIVKPAGFNFPPVQIQWQKDGKAIPGATGKSFNLKGVKAADAGTYSVVLTASSGQTVNSQANLKVVPDTFPPIPMAGALAKGGKQEIGVAFDEDIKIATANVLANYSLSGGKLESIRVVNRPVTGFAPSLGIKEYNSVVLTASGLTAGQTYQLTVKNVEDAKGNKIPAAGTTLSFQAEGDLTWNVIGANESGFANDVVRLGGGEFDVVSSGVAFWADYDEGTFVNQQVEGNFDAKVQLIEQDPSSQWARTGLMAREALDEGKGRPDRQGASAALVDGEYTIPKADLFSRLQDVHANPSINWDLSASNNGFENHYRDETTYVRGWGDQLQSVGVGVVPAYPDVWMRLTRQGETLTTYRSTDGNNWVEMSSRSFPDLASTLYVGMSFMPELDNNGTKAGLGHGVLAKYRNYSITTGSGGAAGPIRIGINFGADEPNGGNQFAVGATESAGAPGYAQTHWNNVTLLNGSVPKVTDSAGNSSPMSVEWASNNTWASTGRSENNATSFKPGSPDQKLLGGYLDTGAATTSSVKLTGIPATLTASGFDVVIYALGGVASGRSGAYRIVDGSGNVLKDYVLATSATSPSDYEEVPQNLGAGQYGAGTHIVFKGLKAANITIEATTADGLGAGSPPRAPINAIQLVPAGSGDSGGGGSKIAFARTATGVTLTYQGTLQSADSITGPFTDVAGASSPATISFSGSGKFYRTRQ